MTRASIVRSLLAVTLLLTLPSVPALHCAANGGMAHVCCSDRCACEGHGSSARRPADPAHAGHTDTGSHAHRHAAAHAPEHAAATPDSCAIDSSTGRDRDDAAPAAGINVSTERPATLAVALDLAAPDPQGTPLRASPSTAPDRARDVLTPPPRKVA